ncbi:MAG: alpha/beta fold hydrolase [Actinomyces sp.]|nr:MAG: alpha/beta fold hydrolase [Actinomyces sp.]
MTRRLDRRFTVDGVTLAWARVGHRRVGTRPFVLVHGYTGSAHDFAGHIDHLITERELVLVDLRGHGHSGRAATPDAYRVERLVGDLVALLDEAVGEPVDLLGHSLGGRLALHVALERPDLVASLVLMDTTAWSFEIVDPERAEAARRVLDEADDEELTALLATPWPGPETDLVERTVPIAWRAEARDEKLRVDPVAARTLGRALFTGALAPIEHRLGELTMPVTVIVGSHDEPFATHAPTLAAAVPDGRLEVIEGAWHSPQLTHPDEWRAAVARHLARVAALL